MQDLVDALGKLLLEFSLRRALGLALLLVLLAGGVAAYERMTSNFRLARIEHIATIAAKLNAMEAGTPIADPVLKDVQTKLKAELQAASKDTPLRLTIPSAPPPTIGVAITRFLSGAGIWFLLAVMVSTTSTEEHRRKQARSGNRVTREDALRMANQAGALSLLCGLVSIFMPLRTEWWFLVFVYPLVLFIIGLGVFSIFELLAAKPATAATQTSPGETPVAA